MSNYALINSPNSPFEYYMENENSPILIPSNTTGALIPVIAIQTSTGTTKTLTIPAGTYNIQMIATLGSAIADTSIYCAQLALFNNTTGVLIATSQSCPYIGGDDPTNSFTHINTTQRIVLTSDTIVKVVLLFTYASQNFNIITNTNYDGYNQNARLIVNSTF
jgi:hypothetical protein